MELHQKIQDYESRSGIFGDKASEAIKVELEKAKDYIYKLTDERDRLVNQNDSLQIKLHNTQKYYHMAIEDKQNYREKLERFKETRTIEETLAE